MVKNYDQKPTTSASATHSDERISVVKLSKSGGCVDRDASFMKAVNEAQIRSYFFGSAAPSTAAAALSLSAGSSSTKVTLSPHTQQLDFDPLLALYSYTVPTADEDEDEYDPSQFGAGDSFFPGGGVGSSGGDYSTTQSTNHNTNTYDPAAAISASTPTSSDTVPLKKVPPPPPSALSNTLIAITHAAANAPPSEIRDASVMGFVYVADVDPEKRKIRVLAPVGGRMPARALVWGKKWPGEVVGLVG
jgi:polyribonucleotide 5'-hydroxyl-kinase